MSGVEFVRSINAESSHLFAEEEAPNAEERADLAQFVKDHAWGHHACGTCKIGRKDDRWAVLDGNFNVYGTHGLRVVDASVFPRIPGFFIVTSIYMVAEKAADLILAAAKGETIREAKRVSLWDTLRLQLRVTIPAYFSGLVAPWRRGMALLSGFDTGQARQRLFDELRSKYASDHLWTWFPLRRTLLVFDPDTMDAVLESEQNAPDPTLKKRPLSRFTPEGLIVSSGDVWRGRRTFNEGTLDFKSLHHNAAAFLEIVRGEVDRVAVECPLRWSDFQRLADRISQQVLLGAGCIDPELAGAVAKMVSWSNLPLRHKRSFRTFYEKIEGHLARHRGQPAKRGRAPADEEQLPTQCLVHRSAESLERGASESTRVPDQIAFWAFVLKDGLALHVPRTLALIAAHEEVQHRLRPEILGLLPLSPQAIDDHDYLDGCLVEQLRLWTPVPILLRRAVEDFTLRGGIPIEAEQQILVHAGYHHRDPRVFGAAAHRFSPASAAEHARDLLVFSRHQRSCAGEFLARFLIKATLACLLARCRFELIGPRVDPKRIPHLYNHFRVELRGVEDA